MPIYLREDQVLQAFEAARRNPECSRLRLDVSKKDDDVIHATIGSDVALHGEDQICFRSEHSGVDLQPDAAPGASLLIVATRQGDECNLVAIQSPLSRAHSEVVLLPTENSVFARHTTVLDSRILAGKSVAIFGVGSVGSMVAVELAKSGVGSLHLVDHDRVEIHNVSRHACGLSDLGRLKVRAVRDLILDRHAACLVTADAFDVLNDPDRVSEIVRRVDAVIVLTDNNASRLLINEACLENNTAAFFGRALTRAHALDVTRLRPGKSACYQCLIGTILAKRGEEISSQKQAARISYSDRPVRAEPGLANDLAPLNSLLVKLCIQHLIKDTDSDLRSLDEDLKADLYFWVNRRAHQHADWDPMSCSTGSCTILRWYDIDTTVLPRCPMCRAFYHHP